jgi:hypothetical protein
MWRCPGHHNLRTHDHSVRSRFRSAVDRSDASADSAALRLRFWSFAHRTADLSAGDSLLLAPISSNHRSSYSPPATIWTESSHMYTAAEIEELAVAAGFRLRRAVGGRGVAVHREPPGGDLKAARRAMARDAANGRSTAEAGCSESDSGIGGRC